MQPYENPKENNEILKDITERLNNMKEILKKSINP